MAGIASVFLSIILFLTPSGAMFPSLHHDHQTSLICLSKVLYKSFESPNLDDVSMAKVCHSTERQHLFVTVKFLHMDQPAVVLARKNFARHIRQKLLEKNDASKLTAALVDGSLSFEPYGEEGGGYTLTYAGYKSKRPILVQFSAISVNAAPPPYPAFGKTAEESRDIATALAQSVLKGSIHGSVTLNHSIGEDLSFSSFHGPLTYSIEYLTLPQSAKHLCDVLMDDLILVKDDYTTDQNVYALSYKDKSDEKIRFKLNFTNSQAYDMWQRLLPIEPPKGYYTVPDFQQRCSSLFFKHFHFVTESCVDIKQRVSLVAPFFTPEMEWCKRIKGALEKKGFQVLLCLSTFYDDRHRLYKSSDEDVYTDDDQALFAYIYRLVITAFNPKFTLTTYHKFFATSDTRELKIGCLSIYPEPLWDDETVYARVCDFDAVIHANPDPAPLRAIMDKAGVSKPIIEFYPSCAATIFEARPANAMFYCGANWDGLRGSDKYKEFFTLLESRGPLEIYGHQEKWTHLKTAYKGFIPFEGDGLKRAIAETGVVLCLHSNSHLDHGIPTARFFEAVAAGALVICDDHPFFKKHFAGACLFIDQTQSAESMANQVMTHWAWIKDHPTEASAMAKRAHEIFVTQYSLEKYVGSVLDFVDEKLGVTHRIM